MTKHSRSEDCRQRDPYEIPKSKFPRIQHPDRPSPKRII
jgi:hypothetical protein